MKPMFKIGDIVRITQVLEDVVDNGVAYPVGTVGVVCCIGLGGENRSYGVVSLRECAQFSRTGMNLILNLKGRYGFLYMESELKKVSLYDMKVQVIQDE
nr:hypothetical protein [uncultured Lachnoclostridium sp.]